MQRLTMTGDKALFVLALIDKPVPMERTGYEGDDVGKVGKAGSCGHVGDCTELRSAVIIRVFISVSFRG